MAEEVRRPHGHRQHGERRHGDEVLQLRQAELPATVLAPPVHRIEVGDARLGMELERRAEGEGDQRRHRATQRNRQPARAQVFQVGVQHDGGQHHHEGQVAHVEAVRPGEQRLDLRGHADEAQVEQQAATHAVTGQPRQQAAAAQHAEQKAQHTDHDAQRHGVAAGGDDQRNQRNQRPVGAGQVGGGNQEAGEQHHEQQRGDQHLVAHVLDDEVVGQAQRPGEGGDHRGDHDDLADGGGHGRHPVLVLEAVVTEGQVGPPAPWRHDGQLVLQIVRPPRERRAGLVERLIALGLVVHNGVRTQTEKRAQGTAQAGNPRPDHYPIVEAGRCLLAGNARALALGPAEPRVARRRAGIRTSGHAAGYRPQTPYCAR